MVKVSDLRMREVINIADGRRMGPIKDIDIDLEQGRVSAIILPGQSSRFLGLFGREEEIIVPWHKIKKIGLDVILIDLRDITEVKPDNSSAGNGKERFFQGPAGR
ncbi:YlmC/YmxH family sporulation protein [Desulfofundulus thermocisternus]|uniref:YlmC/YmxH family sporulation protein n=1 Tax=Desulfofundulus thermocisternus TaxID=42471 RepID=UPI0019FEA9D4|nr:YlmC/YmxH family sporulation protein [Desulfofundulus thermocisternus]MBE3584814.1 YlmC/YmxH family sporulation protein [Thermoanaerobacter sp.]MCS5694683.1 YlmC/YmxH family sporulation protein [Desulfofundulus thermocisternus]